VGGKLGSRRQYQRILHESYQFLVKFIADQQAAQAAAEAANAKRGGKGRRGPYIPGGNSSRKKE